MMQRAHFAVAFVIILAACSSRSITPLPTQVAGVAPDVIQRQPPPNPDWTSAFIPGSGGHNADPRPIVSDGKNTMWIGLSGYNAIASVAMGQAVHVRPISSGAGDLVVGPDHNVWVIGGNGYIAQVTPGGVETDFSIGGPGTFAGFGLVVGPDGALWFPVGSSTAAGVGRVTTAGAYTFFPTSSNNYNDMTVGPDGNFWLTNESGFVDSLTTSGVQTQYPVSGIPTFITAGPDGALWFIDGNLTLGRITTSGSVSYFTATGFHSLSQIIRGSGSSLWIAYDSGIVGFNTSTDTFSAPIVRGSFAMQGYLAYGPDRNVWATAGNSSVLTYIRLDMTVTPSSLTLPGPGQGQTLTVSESNYKSTWSAASSKTSIATVSQPSKGTFMVTGVAPGSCVITISDTSKNMVRVPVTVQ